ATRSAEAVRIGTFLDGKVLVVHHVFRPDDSLQTLEVGALLPTHATALGKVLLAYDANAASAVTTLEPYSRRTITNRRDLARALTAVREVGWANSIEEMTVGEAAIAAPIRGHGGLVVGAIGASGAVDRICDRNGQPRSPLVAYVRDAARAISRDLGAARW
ncbi:MAG: IclR family transcriptional regulator, partial [Micromonosporaceae bacterium]